LTTLRLGDIPAAGGAAVAAACCAFADIVRPVRTAAALMMALRIRNVRRSTPAGTSMVAISSAFETGDWYLSSCAFMSRSWVPFYCIFALPADSLPPAIRTGNSDGAPE
jgi:hypothetical protein